MKPGLEDVENNCHITHPPDKTVKNKNDDKNSDSIKPSANEKITAQPPQQSENCSKRFHYLSFLFNFVAQIEISF